MPRLPDASIETAGNSLTRLVADEARHDGLRKPCQFAYLVSVPPCRGAGYDHQGKQGTTAGQDGGPNEPVHRCAAGDISLALLATCNLGMSADAAGVDRRVIYDRLRHDEAFASAFHVAEETGVQNLRAELVRRLQAVTPDEVAPASLPGLDSNFILNLLKQHERSLGVESGDRRPRRSNAAEAAARLAKLMERMREEHRRELAAKRAAKAKAKAAEQHAAEG
ncbi:hypothetical protein V6R86_00560 [Sphingomonas kaistensis]|uniref:Uncharacterized protein n=1 Tax=Sphingomonas kaistensis TaxID=298708 RepID=A0ABZ2FX51_9SPHN